MQRFCALLRGRLNTLKEVVAVGRTLVRLWKENLCTGGMLGRSVAWFALLFWGMWLLLLFSGGFATGAALIIVNIEGGAGYWIHVLPVPAFIVLEIALLLAVVELAGWQILYAVVLKGWPAWRSRSENQDDVRSLGNIARALDYISQKADWREDPATRESWLFRHRYLALYLQGIWPGAFIVIGLPFAFKYDLPFTYPVLYLGNATKITLFVLGWVHLPLHVSIPLFVIVLLVAERFKDAIAERHV